jgi:serine/threonine-protein kinase SRPK3
MKRNLRGTYPTEYVAVKVLTVHQTAGELDGYIAELDTLRSITNKNSSHPGYKHCPRLYDEFITESHHGPHICYVTDVFGLTMASLRLTPPGVRHPFSVRATKRIIKQTLLALDYLHRECRFVHTGMLRPACICQSLLTL